MRRIAVRVKGISPVLQNRFNEEAEEQVSTNRRPSMKAKKDRTPRDWAESVSYRLPSGELYQPSVQMFQACINAGKFHKLGRKQLDRFVAACFSIEEQYLGHGTDKFEVDSRPITNPTTKGKQMKHRPRLDEWALNFHLLLDEDIIDVDTAYLIVQDAGRRVGIGDYRPDKRGPFGRFVITEWEDVTNDGNKKKVGRKKK